MTILDAALDYHRAGLAVWPAIPEEKRPAGVWGGGKNPRPMDEKALKAWGGAMRGLCVLCGNVSGGVECIDFDDKGSVFDAWQEAVRVAHPELLARLVMERSPSGGVHVVYRCPEADRPKTSQLAFAPDDGRLLIETRGDGAVFLCDPSPGYKLFQGAFTAVPTITFAERDALIALAAAQGVPKKAPAAPRPPVAYVPVPVGEMHPYIAKALADEAAEVASCPEGGRNHRLNKAAFKLGHYVGGGMLSEDMVRSELTRAALAAGLGAHETALSITSGIAAGMRDPKGVPEAPPDDGGVNMDGLAAQARRVAQGPVVEVLDVEPEVEEEILPDDPGPVPESLAHIPGFVSAVTDYTLACMAGRNPITAFCGAFALQAHLGGRKVRDPGDARTNFYLLALADPGSGKDPPRKVNHRIMGALGLSSQLGKSFASGEALQDALSVRPAMLFQTDEIDALLQSINKAKDGRMEGVMAELQSLYTSADNVYPVRHKANADRNAEPLVIDQPCLNILGTAPPAHFYAALSERMLTNGLFARMLVIEADMPIVDKEARIIEIPDPIIDTARWWAEFRPPAPDGARCNLSEEHPRPLIVPRTPDADEILAAWRSETIAIRNDAKRRNDMVTSTTWSRTYENTVKLSLVHAISANHQSPRIDAEAADWAVRFMRHQTRRMVFMIRMHVCENDVHARKQQIIRLLRNAPDGRMTKSQLTRRTRALRPKERDDLLLDLFNSREIAIEQVATGGRLLEMVRLR